MKLKALAATALVAVLAWYSIPARAQIVGNANSDRAPQTVAEFELGSMGRRRRTWFGKPNYQ